MGLRGPIALPGSRRHEKRRKDTARDVIGVTMLTIKDRPEWLTGEGERIWNELVALVGRDKGLQWLLIDCYAVAAFCAQVAHLRAAEQDLCAQGLVLRTPPSRRRPDGVPFPNPNIKVAQMFRKNLLDWARTLGLTPESRKRLGWQPTPQKPDPNDAWAKFD